MKILKRIVLTLLIVAAVLAAVSFLLPREIAIARSTIVNAPPQSVFPYVNDLRKVQEWSPWAKIDPDAQFSYEGPDGGTGQIVRWSSVHKHVGTGSQTIVNSVENESVQTELDFGSHGTAQAAIRLDPDENATIVTWEFMTDVGMNPIGRYMGLMMETWVGEKYDEGLANLKALVEGQPS